MSLASASSLPTPVARPRIEGNGDDRRAAEAHQHVGQRLQAGRPGWNAKRVLKRRQEVVMRDEEAFDGAVEYDHLHVRIGLNRGDDVVEQRKVLWTEDVHRRHVEGDTPVCRQAALQANVLGGEDLYGAVHCWHS
ncbi:hypothetical protein ACVWZ3_005996 [Bradyrhizobium sp. i1.3.6]